MKRISSIIFIVCLCLLSACGDEYCVTGTIAECSEERVAVEVTHMTDVNDTTDVSGTRVTFPLSETGVPPIDGAVVGDVVEVIYRGKLTPADKGDLDALGFNLATKELRATLQALEPDYLLVSPLDQNKRHRKNSCHRRLLNRLHQVVICRCTGYFHIGLPALSKGAFYPFVYIFRSCSTETSRPGAAQRDPWVSFIQSLQSSSLLPPLAAENREPIPERKESEGYHPCLPHEP